MTIVTKRTSRRSNQPMLTLFQKALWFALFGIVLIGFADQEIRIANRPISEPQQRPHFVQSPRAPVEAEIKTPEGAIVDWVSRLFDFRLTDVLIVFFTALLASKTAGLYTETAALRSVADAQRGDLLRSIRAAEDLAHAAQKSADVAEAALTIAERPYFVPREPKLKMYRFGQPGMPPSDPQTWVGTLEYGFLNMGRTVGFLKGSYGAIDICGRATAGAKILRSETIAWPLSSWLWK